MKVIFLLLTTLTCLNVAGQRIVREYHDFLRTNLKSEYQVDNVSGVKNGYYKEYGPNGILYSTGFYKKGLETGTWKSYHYTSGELWSIANYTNGQIDGVYKDGGQLKNGKFRAERIMKNGIEEQGTYYNDDGKEEKIYSRNGVCKLWRSDGTLEKEWTNVEGYEVQKSAKFYLKNGKPSVEIKEGKTYTYSIEDEKLESMEYDSAEFHFLYAYEIPSGILQRIFRDNNKTKETQGRYFLNHESVKVFSFGPQFDLTIRDPNNAGIKNGKNQNNRLYIAGKDFYDLSSMCIVTMLPYQGYTNRVFDGLSFEQFGYKDKQVRLKTFKTKNELNRVTWYYPSGKVQSEYYSIKNNPESGLVGMGTEYNEAGIKLKEIYVPKDSIGYYREFAPSGTISFEYGLDSHNWDESNSKKCVNYREFYPSGKIYLEYGLFSSGFNNTEYYESGKKRFELSKEEGLNNSLIFYDEAGNVTNMKEICNEIITSNTKAFEKHFTTTIWGGDPSGRLPVLKTPDNVYYSVTHPIGEDVYSMFLKVLDIIKLQYANATTSDDQKNSAITYGRTVVKLISIPESEALKIYEQLNSLGRKDLKNVENIKRVIGI